MDEATQLAWLYDLYRMGQSESLRDVSSGETISSIPQHILQHIVTCFKADTGSIALCKVNNGNKLQIVAAAGLPDIMIGSVIPKDKSVLGWVVEKGEPILLNGDT